MFSKQEYFKKYPALSLTVIILAFFPISVMAQQLHLYGGQNHDEYLGCITCSKHDPKSIWNAYTEYGSDFGNHSIWNEMSEYGNDYSVFSPWNEYASYPPAVVDKAGNFYGYFTTNEYNSKRTTIEWLVEILDNWEWIRDNFEKYVNELN